MKSQNQNSRESLTLYLREIAIIPLINRDEEIVLGKQIQKGSQEALKTLVESNLRFVVKIAKKYSRLGCSLQDLINEGNLGLLEAAKRFDPDRGVRFISYAVWWIRQSIFSALSNHSHPVRIPVKIHQTLLKIRAILAANQDLPDGHTRSTLSEIGQAVGLTQDQMTIALQAGGKQVSLHDPLHAGSEQSIGDTIEQHSVRSTDRDVADESVRRSLRSVLRELKDREQKVLILRFGLGQDRSLTLNEIGHRLGVSRERIRQIESKALLKLRSRPQVRAMKSILSENLDCL